MTTSPSPYAPAPPLLPENPPLDYLPNALSPLVALCRVLFPFPHARARALAPAAEALRAAFRRLTVFHNPPQRTP